MTNSAPNNIDQLPGPKGIPLLGNLLQLDLHNLHRILEQWADDYGAVYKLKLGQKTVAVIADNDLIQQILRQRPHTYRRVQAIEDLSYELGTHGVFAAEGEQWQRQRQLTMQAFKQDNLKRFFPTMQQITKRLLQHWQTVAQSKEGIDVRREWMRFTVDVTTQFAFGYDINLIEKGNDDFQQHLERQLPGFNRRLNAPFPYWRFIKLPSDRALEKSLNVIQQTIKSFISQAKQRLALQQTPQANNFLEAMLLTQTEADGGFSDEEIQGNIITMLLAGEDTTAHTLSWLTYFLLENPNVQQTLQQEINQVLGSNDIPPDLACLEQLPYCEAVIHETLRLKSVAPLLFLEPLYDVELQGLAVPKGTMLMLTIRHAALQEQHFSSAQDFLPERWLHTEINSHHNNRSASIPFGAGPRFCPGRQLAIFEMKMALATLCKNFTFHPVPENPQVKEVFSFTMMPSDLEMTLQPF